VSEAAVPAPRVLRSLDGWRAQLLRRLGPSVHPFLRDRERRVVAVALVGLGLSFTLTAAAPLALLGWGPILLGVPHLFADFRYLVFRPSWHAHRASIVAVGLPLLAMCLYDAPFLGWSAVLGAAVVSPGRRRRVVTAGVAFACVVASVLWPSVFRLLLVHGHNAVALGLWWSWRGGSAERWKPIVWFLALYGAILAGGLDALVPVSAPAFSAWEKTLAPGLDTPHRWVLAFAFAQSVHYGVWLRWIPEDDRDRFTPRPLSASWRAAVEDSGRWVVYATIAATLALGTWALGDASAARLTYLRFVQFHGYLELAAIASWCAGRPRAVGAG
jgi:hypothetical protein